MIPRNVHRIFVHTGNLLNCKEFNKRATQSPAEEVYESIKWNLMSCVKENICEIDDSGTLRCTYSPDAVKVDKADRINLKLTVKVFLQSYDTEHLKDAITEVMKCLDVTFMDSFILALPSAPPVSVQLVQPLWKMLEEFVTQGVIVTIGVSDLDTGQLSELYNWAQVKPSVNQVNLESCCVMPPEMTAFAKENDIQLLTHSDPKDLLPSQSLKTMLEPIVESTANWKSSWIVRYSVVVKCRGIIQNKGYLFCAAESPAIANGPVFN